jgi:ISXO2-like transposase domain
MCHKIRTAMVEDIKQLGDIVEVDKTYVGGSDKNRHWDKKSGTRGRGDTGKTPVVGAVRRKGNVVEKTDRLTLEAFARETISNRVSLPCTDAYPGYSRLKRRFPHQSVDHTIGQHIGFHKSVIQSQALWAATLI